MGIENPSELSKQIMIMIEAFVIPIEDFLTCTEPEIIQYLR